VTQSFDTVIVGGGVVGSICALTLSRSGLSTLIVDNPSDVRPASYGNAGHIALEQATPLASQAALRSAAGRLFAFGGPLDFRLRDIATWGPWAIRYLRACTPEATAAGTRALGTLLAGAGPAWRALVQDLGAPDLFIERGHLLVWESIRTAARGRANWNAAEIGTARVRDLSGDERAAVQARIARPLADGLGFDGAGQIADVSRLLEALDDVHRSRRGHRRAGRVIAISETAGRPRVALDDGAVLTPDLVVVAGGVGSGPLMRGCGHVAPVVAERGYHIEGAVGDWGDLPPVVFEDRAMIVTRLAGRLRASSFLEFAHARSPADPRKWEHLRRHASALGLPLATGAVATWMGARPTLPDYLPAIGRSRRIGGLIYAFGHQHLGLTLSAVTGALVGALALGRTPAIDLRPFDLARFERGSSGGTTLEGRTA
jgi:glycine/D-amino acid oxidase-like deaminating enzyme